MNHQGLHQRMKERIALFVKDGAADAPAQPEDPEPSIGRPTPSHCQTAPPPPPDWRDSTRPCIGRPIAFPVSQERETIRSHWRILVGDGRWCVVGYGERHSDEPKMMAREVGCPRRTLNRRWRAREYPELASVQEPLLSGWDRREEGRSDFLPWYRPVGVVEKTSSESHGGRAGLPVERANGHHVV